jgi:hypothetical protein
MENKLLVDILKLLKSMGTLKVLDTKSVKMMIDRIEKVVYEGEEE